MQIINFSAKKSLLNIFVREIRDVEIQKDRLRFRRNLERIGEVMAYEISRELNYEQCEVETPLGRLPVGAISDSVVLGTILRAGLAFHHGFLNYFDRAGNAFVSAYRKYDEIHRDFDIHIDRLPAGIEIIRPIGSGRFDLQRRSFVRFLIRDLLCRRRSC